MPSPVQLPAARRRLNAALEALAERGARTACQTPIWGDIWFSDDPLERRRAMTLCRTCPIQQLCREYRDALDSAPRWRGANMHHPKHAPGVWGGVDYTRTPDAEPRRRAS